MSVGAISNASIKGASFSFRELILMEPTNWLLEKRLHRSIGPLMSQPKSFV